MNKSRIKKLSAELKNAGIEFLENESMSAHSSIKIGGMADLLIFPKNEEELIYIISSLKANSCGYHIVGRGTNTLFKDERICVPIISFRKFSADLTEIRTDGYENFIMEIGAGASLPRILNYAIKNNIGGCEFFYGIPGTVGGAVRMNAGSKESAMESIVEAIDVVAGDGSKHTIDKKDLKFSYRNLDVESFNGDYFIIKARFKFYISTKEKIRKNIQIFKERKLVQPLGEFSLGCIFKNPPNIPAGKVVEEIGFKGFSNGGVSVSKKHANFIINRGDAKPADIISLIKNIQEKALSRKGIKLDTEIKII